MSHFNSNEPSGLQTAFLYSIVAVGGLVSLSIIANASNPIGAFIGIAVLWTVAILFYRKRRGIVEWSDSELPLKEYLKNNQEQNTIPSELSHSSVLEKHDNLDSHGFTPLTEAEAETWDSLTKDFNDNEFDKPSKPTLKKNRKKKD